MQIQCTDAEEKIAALASSVEADARSWKDWSLLHIETNGIDEDRFQDVMIASKAITGSYFKDIKGTAYFCRNHDMYIVCKSTPLPVLEQAGRQICALAFGQNGLQGVPRIYSNLEKDGYKFSESVFNRIARPFVHTSCGIDRLIGDTIENLSPSENRQGNAVKVLLVEDDPVTRWMIGSSLEHECEFIALDNAGRVFSSYPSYKPDVVFLDIGLPDNDGDAVLEWIMRNDPGACVVMLSGRDSAENISGCIEKGAKGFLSKPVVKDGLMHYIQRYR